METICRPHLATTCCQLSMALSPSLLARVLLEVLGCFPNAHTGLDNITFSPLFVCRCVYLSFCLLSVRTSIMSADTENDAETLYSMVP